MTEEGLTLRDLKKQERLEKRGGSLARLPPRFHQRAARLREQLQEALEACEPDESARYLDLHEDLQKLEGLMREITVSRERKLLLGAHEAVSGLSPDTRHIEEQERPLFEDLKQVLSSHRQRVFAGPEAASVKLVPPTQEAPAGGAEADTAVPVPGGQRPMAVSTPAPEPQAPVPPAAPPAPAGKGPTKGVRPEVEVEGQDRVDTEGETPVPGARSTSGPEVGPPAPSGEGGSPRRRAVSSRPGRPKVGVERGQVPEPGTYQVVRVLENVQPFTGIDAQVYSLKAQDVVSLPVFNARRLAEVGIVTPVGGSQGVDASSESERAPTGGGGEPVGPASEG